MKIRNGFVSNSSSSSFVVLLPENFDFEKHVEENFDKLDKWTKDDILERYEYDGDDSGKEKFEKEKSIEILKDLKKHGYFDSYENYFEMNVVNELLADYIIVSMESGPDSGYCELMNKDGVNRIKNILKKVEDEN
jgi:hypothetical protein